MPQDADHEHHPPLTRTDASLLAALVEGSHDGCRVDLRTLVHDVDWLNRAIPTFDEVSFGLQRLVAAGFLIVDSAPETRLMLHPTPKAIHLRRSLKARSLGDVLTAMQRAVEAAPYPEPEVEDRSRGRLPGLELQDFDAAVRDHGAWVERWSKPLVVAARAFSKWQSHKRP